MYLARFCYDVLPVNRQRAIDFIRREELGDLVHELRVAARTIRSETVEERHATCEYHRAAVEALRAARRGRRLISCGG